MATLCYGGRCARRSTADALAGSARVQSVIVCHSAPVHVLGSILQRCASPQAGARSVKMSVRGSGWWPITSRTSRHRRGLSRACGSTRPYRRSRRGASSQMRVAGVGARAVGGAALRANAVVLPGADMVGAGREAHTERFADLRAYRSRPVPVDVAHGTCRSRTIVRTSSNWPRCSSGRSSRPTNRIATSASVRGPACGISKTRKSYR